MSRKQGAGWHCRWTENSRALYASAGRGRSEPRKDRESQVITEVLFGSYNNLHLCVAS